ncbi:DUF6455 family protein [Seohaeicola saemankumensis]|nr:DUF6455 family protein [Seohaeicola saemankumensis]MCA0872382.1 DUF6455 family protein [Seohaeicola saemankumensis]
MGVFTKISKSAELVGGMIERLGTDLAGWGNHDPELEAVRYRAMVMRCSGCPDQSGCRKLQDQNSHLDHAPDYCQNRAVLAQMKAG